MFEWKHSQIQPNFRWHDAADETVDAFLVAHAVVVLRESSETMYETGSFTKNFSTSLFPSAEVHGPELVTPGTP